MNVFVIKIEDNAFIVNPTLENESVRFNVFIEGQLVIFGADNMGNISAIKPPIDIDSKLLKSISERIESFYL